MCLIFKPQRRVAARRFEVEDLAVQISGDSLDGTGATDRANRHGRFATLLAAVPVGGSPTVAGGSPTPPIFKAGSENFALQSLLGNSLEND